MPDPTEASASKDPQQPELPVALTLTVLGAGVAVGFVVIGIIWAICWFLNRRYAGKLRKKHEEEQGHRLLGASQQHLHAHGRNQSRYNSLSSVFVKDKSRDKEKETRGSVQVQVQVVRTGEGATQSCLMEDGAYYVPGLLSPSGSDQPETSKSPSTAKSPEMGSIVSVVVPQLHTESETGYEVYGAEEEVIPLSPRTSLSLATNLGDCLPCVPSEFFQETVPKPYRHSEGNTTGFGPLGMTRDGSGAIPVGMDSGGVKSDSSPTISRLAELLMINREFVIPVSYVKSGEEEDKADPPSEMKSCSKSPSVSKGVKSAQSRAYAHPLLHPSFHSHSNEESPVIVTMTRSTSSEPLTFLDLTSPEAPGAPSQIPVDVPLLGHSFVENKQVHSPSEITALTAPGTHESSITASPSCDLSLPSVGGSGTLDPCIALWDLRSTLENQASPGESLLLWSMCSEKSDDGLQETLARLLPDPGILLTSFSSPTGGGRYVRNPVTEELFMTLTASADVTRQSGSVPVSTLTSLTSFESNTPSEESFDATTCAKALEAIFDEPSDLPPSTPTGLSPAPRNLQSASGAYLTPPVQLRQKRKQTPPKLTSQQKRQSFKKAHRSAASHSSRVQAATEAASPAPADVTVTRTSPTEKTPTIEPVVATMPEKSDFHRRSSKRSEAKKAFDAGMAPAKLSRPTSPSRDLLQQMKNDSGYKSQSFDTASTSNVVTPPQIHSYKSVPTLSYSRMLSAIEDAAFDTELELHPLLVPELARTPSLEMMAVEQVQFSTSSSCDDPVDFSGSDTFMSMTSSMEMEAHTLPALSKLLPKKPIPLLRTHPATPTSSSPPRDWAIDEQSDRLFREFTRFHSRPKPLVPNLTVKTSIPSTNRQHRALRSKLKAYSPSSSHGGTPAQASIEETEEELDASVDSTATDVTVVPRVISATGSPEKLSGSKSLGNVAAEVYRSQGTDSPMNAPDFFICTTREQVTTRMSMRSRSPKLRHVPIIKLPDQESDEV